MAKVMTWISILLIFCIVFLQIHRIGQNRTCFYYQMICSGSREESILDVLNMRKDYTEDLFEKEG